MDIEKIKAAVLVAIGVTDTRPMQEQLKNPHLLGLKARRPEEQIPTAFLSLEEAIEQETIQRISSDFSNRFIDTFDITPAYIRGEILLTQQRLLESGSGAIPLYKGQSHIVVKDWRTLVANKAIVEEKQ